MNRPVSPLLHDYKSAIGQKNRRSKPLQWFVVGLGLPLLGVALAISVRSPGTDQPEATLPKAQTGHAELRPIDPTPETELPFFSFDDHVNPALEHEFHPPLTLPLAAYDSLQLTVHPGDTLDRLFRKNGLDLANLATIVRLPEAGRHLKLLRPGDELEIRHDEGKLLRLYRKLDLTSALVVTRVDDAFTATIEDRPIETRRRSAYGRIDSSLFHSAAASGLSDKLIMNLAGIFAWDVDFVLDIRVGDDYYLLYEEIYQDGKFVTEGNVVAAEFNNNGRSFQAVRFVDKEGRADYYTPDGRSVRKAFVRAPVDFTRISSSFNPRRRHPILNTIRAHRGVDYAAPAGTPIKAAGDGKVILRGRHGGYGNTVILQHGGNITTLYAHMSRFSNTAKLGQRVRQGDVIGYVGSSGLATAAHLHYEYRLNGVHRNPRTVPLPQADPIKDEYREEFLATAAPILDELQHYKRTLIASSSL